VQTKLHPYIDRSEGEVAGHRSKVMIGDVADGRVVWRSMLGEIASIEFNGWNKIGKIVLLRTLLEADSGEMGSIAKAMMVVQTTRDSIGATPCLFLGVCGILVLLCRTLSCVPPLQVSEEVAQSLFSIQNTTYLLTPTLLIGCVVEVLGKWDMSPLSEFG